MRNSMRSAVLIGVAVLGSAFSAQAQWTWTPQTGRWVDIKRLPKETAELQIEYARSLMLAGEYNRALRETEKFEEFYAETELADENQFLRAEIRLAQGDLLDAAEDFQQVIVAHPETELYDEAIAKQYEIGDKFYEIGVDKLDDRWTLYKKRPLKRAITVYSMVIDNQPFTPEAAEAQYKVGLSHYAREEYVEAAFEYRRVVEDYSTSEYVDEASYGLAMTYYNQSLPPEYDQSPSALTIDAIDTFAEKYPSDERVPELQGKRAEMRETIGQQRLQTAQFYEKRRQFDAARIYYQVVVDDYSDTPAAQDAQTWLAAHPAPAGIGKTAALETRESF